jgi:hypothetical protein
MQRLEEKFSSSVGDLTPVVQRGRKCAFWKGGGEEFKFSVNIFTQVIVVTVRNKVNIQW